MQRCKQGQLEWLQFDLLSDVPHLHHAVFLRHGGVSQAPYHSLNFDYSVGDNPAHVDENYVRLRQHLGGLTGWKRLVKTLACHKDSVALVEDHTKSKIIDHDAMVSKLKGVTLMSKHADCQIGLFYDPIHHAVANVHSGWRGSVRNIYAHTIAAMQYHFRSNPADLLVCISPSLGPDEAEFIHYRTELPEPFWDFQVRPTYFDFWAISEHQLKTAGILSHHIEVARISTYTNTQDYFSYRKEKVRGCNATCITLL